MRVASIHLWQPGSAHDPELGHYCGCYWVPGDGGPEVTAAFAQANVGTFASEDRQVCRAFFTADEVAARVSEARHLTGCDTEVVWQ